MWCGERAAVAILPILLAGSLIGHSHQALTTFGKSDTQAPKEVKPTTPPDYPTTTPNLYLAPPQYIRVPVPPLRFLEKELIISKDENNAAQSKARICSRQPDCAGITSSSCVRTHYDSVTRCLCGDNSSPINGQCEAQTKTLYHVCAGSEECNDGLICASPNITSASPPHYRVYTPQDKICLCDKENGFVEREHTCSDADILKTSLFAIVVVTCLRKIVTN